MSKTTTITTDYSRELTVINRGYEFNLAVKDTDGKYAVKGEVYSHLTSEQATKLANALVGENATLVTDLPEAKLKHTWVEAGNVDRHKDTDPAEVLEHAKQLLAIHAFLVKAQAEREAAKAAEEAKTKAKEAANAKRRDELASELAEGDPRATYSSRLTVVKKAIDRIIDLEEAAKVS